MRSETSTAVRADAVTVTYGDTVALDELSLHAPGGTITAVLGPNGAGKTTFVRAVATLEPYEGNLEVAGREVAGHPALTRRTIGMAGQHAAVVDKLTGRENLELVARLYGQTGSQAKTSAGEVVESMQLEAFADRRVDACSGGQRRRLDLAVTLVGQPSVLLLDEPTTGLDPRSRSRLWEAVRRLPDNGSTVLLTTQYLEEADALADRIVVIDQGRTIAAGTPSELRRSLATTRLEVTCEDRIAEARLVEVAASLDAEVERDGESAVFVGSFDLDSAYAAVRDAGLSGSVSEFVVQPPSFDDVFLALTTPDSKVTA